MSTDLPGLPAARVRRWLGAALPDRIDEQSPWNPELIAGGLSNITYRLPLPSGNLILRRPPLGDTLPRAHDMLREHRVLAALAQSAVPVPGPLALCTDVDVIGAPFYVMPEIAGAVLRNADDTSRLPADARTAVSDSLVKTLADLHSVDPDDVGLGDYGRRGGYCARQLRTWSQQWERSKTRDLPDMAALIAMLARQLPPDRESTIVHGDYRLDNTIVDLGATPRIAAVLDWELSTLGDPLADLGLTLTYWHDYGDTERAEIPVAAGITAWPGFPTGEQLAQNYASLTGRDLCDLPFYLALGAMKLAVILEGVHARYLSGTTVSAGYERAGVAVPILAARGLRTLAGRAR